MTERPSVSVRPWRGEPAVTLTADALAATFLPEVGMLGVSLRHRGDELLALPRPLARYRQGEGPTGLPLLYPWANRLGERTYRAARRRVDLTGLSLPVDANGLPIHGTPPKTFEVVRLDATRQAAVLLARFDAGADPALLAAFPYPHELAVEARLDGAGLRVTTTLRPTGRRAVPVSFGWHPYLRLPGVSRAAWRLRLPACRRHRLDLLGLPTGATSAQPAEDLPLGRRTYDDHFRLGRDRRYGLWGGGRAVNVVLGPGYGHAQVYAPPGRSFVCIEPMAAPVNALVDGACPLAQPGVPFRAAFRVAIRAA